MGSTTRSGAATTSQVVSRPDSASGAVVTAGTIHDNPWEGVVVDPDGSTQQQLEEGTRTRRHHHSSSNTRRRRRRALTCTDWALHTLVQLFLCADVCGCVFLLVYGLAVLFNAGGFVVWKQPAVFLALESATWLGLRVLSVTAALYYNHIVDYAIGLIAAKCISAWLAVQTTILVLMVLIKHKELKQGTWWMEHVFFFFTKHSHAEEQDMMMSLSSTNSVSTTCVWFLEHVEPWLWLYLLICALLEYPVRWLLYTQYQQRLVQQEEADLQTTALLAQASTQRRPWWWASNRNVSGGGATAEASSSSLDRQPLELGSSVGENDLRQALLVDETGGGDSDPQATDGRNNNGLPEWAREGGGRRRRRAARTEPPSPSIFSSLFFWRHGGGDDESSYYDPRQEGSVDFASVQEEWASRSEEDPHWWSRDDNNPHHGNIFHQAHSLPASRNPQDGATSIPSVVETTSSANNNNNNKTLSPNGTIKLDKSK